MNIRLTEEAVYQAMHLTTEAKTTLANNYNYMRSSVTPLLQEWNDKNVGHFMEILDHFDNYVKATAGNLDRINEMLRQYLAIMEDYNR